VRFTGERPPGYLPNTDPLRTIDTSKLESLGWAPEVSLADGFRRTIESYL
jgi:nucleoside-diphosphate-sugar epimerase